MSDGSLPSELSTPRQSIEPLSIFTAGSDGQRYRSIGTLAWEDVPGFAILTGKNGSGKTQLLELLAYHITGARPRDLLDQQLPVHVELSGASYKPSEIGFIPASGRFTIGVQSSLSGMTQVRSQLLSAAQNLHSSRGDIAATIRGNRILEILGDRNPHTVQQEQLAELFPDDFHYAIDDADVTSGLTHVFIAHRYKILEALERNTPGLDNEGNSLGPTPWDVVNDALLVAGFSYSVIPPTETPLMESFGLRFRDRTNQTDIEAESLSSGEKVILQLVLWAYTAGENGRFPKLLLLDEPDAHLHPSMTTQFIETISEVLVKRYKIRVIMTTHSPSTVALAPENSIFQIDRHARTVTRANNRSDVISLLTAGLITVSKSSKFCFVEDTPDKDFYSALYQMLTDQGPGRDKRSLSAEPSIVFMPVSVGSGAAKIAGGSSVVTRWVEKLNAPPLDKTFVGIIDKDVGNIPSNRIWTASRYSIENYLLDPINIFCLGIEYGFAPTVAGINIRIGDESQIRNLSNNKLQSITNAITGQMLTTGRFSSGELVDVIYTSGKKVKIPRWLVESQGHGLLSTAQQAFSTRFLTPDRLLRALQRVRLIPVEIADIFKEIQKY